ncbi:unnamed protein product [Lathyrus sativus]|nr:unnamed protein product [Lathyrus sativus]
MDNHINIPMLISFFFFLLPQLSLSDYDYSICRDADHFYNCGHLSHISYPFWGHNRPFQCGAGTPFHLICNEKSVTTILISSQNFTVLEINTTAYTIKLKRTDFSLNLCSPQFNSNSLFSPLFQSVNNIIIFYNCTSSPILPAEDSLCGAPNRAFGHVAHSDYGYEHIEESMNCTGHITVPVGADFPIKNNIYGYFERHVLEKGLDKEFEVSYSVNGECLDCSKNQGDCEWNDDIEKQLDSSCYYCPYGSIAYSADCSSYYKNKNAKRRLVIVVGSVVLGAFAVIVAIYFFYKRRKNKTYAKSYVQSRSLSSELTSKDLESGSQYFGRSQNFGVQHFTYSELEEATNYFDPSKELGEGGFGTVYYGKLYDGRSVAVKRLFENNYKRVEQFKNEVGILASLVHPNLVSLYGCTSRHSRELLLVYEYVSNGTVADHLRGKHAKQGKLTWPVRMNIAVETASALKYLHISEIIHRDIKTNNILLDAHFHVKVADFGLSRLFPYDQTHVSTAPQGTPGYVDPEYHQCYQLTDKSDVYSFGVVMIELISSLPAVDITRHRHEINLASMALNRIQNQALHEIVDPMLDFESDAKVKKMIVAMGELAFQCLQSSKDLRPTMDEVLESLKDIQNGGKHKGQPEVMDISSLSDDAVLLNHAPPPLSPDSNVRSNYTTPNTST